jgi:hypothetical protein
MCLEWGEFQMPIICKAYFKLLLIPTHFTYTEFQKYLEK